MTITETLQLILALEDATRTNGLFSTSTLGQQLMRYAEALDKVSGDNNGLTYCGGGDIDLVIAIIQARDLLEGEGYEVKKK